MESEQKLFLDKVHREDNLEELNEQKDIDHLDPIDQSVVDRFYAITASMNETMDVVPELPFDRDVDVPELEAIEALYMAKTGKDVETGGPISGVKRSELLNQALIHLQPILALGLRPEFKQGRAIYDQLVEQINQVRSEIKTAIKVQGYIKKPDKAGGKAEPQDTDGDDDDILDDNPDSPEDPGVFEDVAHPGADGRRARPKKRSLWQRLTGQKADAENSDDEPEKN